MWQTKYASAVPKNLGLGLNFRLCSEGYFLSGCLQSVVLHADGPNAHTIYLLVLYSSCTIMQIDVYVLANFDKSRTIIIVYNDNSVYFYANSFYVSGLLLEAEPKNILINIDLDCLLSLHCKYRKQILELSLKKNQIT